MLCVHLIEKRRNMRSKVVNAEAITLYASTILGVNALGKVLAACRSHFQR